MSIRKRTWTILGGAVALALTAATFASPVIGAEYHAPAFHPASRDWEACVMLKAIQYSGDPDSVEAMVRVALWACKDERSKFTKSLYEKTKKDGYDSKANIDAEKTADIIRGGMTKDAEVLVLELRSGSVLAPSLRCGARRDQGHCRGSFVILAAIAR